MRASCRLGFTLAEVLVATTVTLLLAGALLAVFGPGSLAFRAQPAMTDMQQRLRFAADVLAARVSSAGSAPPGGLTGVALGMRTACILPYRVGHRRPDPPGSSHAGTLTVMAGKPNASVGFLRLPLPAGEAVAALDPLRCGGPALACGILADMNVLLLAGGGRADLFRVVAVDPPVLTLVPSAATRPRTYPAGTPVVPVDIDVFYLRDQDEGPQLMRYDGWESDLPLLDHVARFEVAFLGSADPPRYQVSQAAVAAPTYGPSPPPAGVDEDDEWGAGENCVFRRVDGTVVPRLPVIGTRPTAPVRLAPAALADGPWCPDASAANGFDADLLRVRRVQLVLSVEATAASARGPDARFFEHPGQGANPHAVAPDQQITLDLAPRSLSGW